MLIVRVPCEVEKSLKNSTSICPGGAKKANALIVARTSIASPWKTGFVSLN